MIQEMRVESSNFDASVGHAHMIVIGADGGFDVGSDPRADGGTLAT